MVEVQLGGFMYDKDHIKQDLIREFKITKNIYEFDSDIKYVDIRLQLVDGTYYIYTGDSQYDIDHHGSWGYWFIDCNRDYDDSEYEEIADKIIGEAFYELD